MQHTLLKKNNVLKCGMRRLSEIPSTSLTDHRSMQKCCLPRNTAPSKACHQVSAAGCEWWMFSKEEDYNLRIASYLSVHFHAALLQGCVFALGIKYILTQQHISFLFPVLPLYIYAHPRHTKFLLCLKPWRRQIAASRKGAKCAWMGWWEKMCSSDCFTEVPIK